MSKSSITNIVIVVAVIVVGFLAYKFFFAASPADTSGLVGLAPAGINSEGQAQSDQFFVLLTDLKQIDLSNMNKVLATLGALEDFSVELEPQDPGRTNPFAPIGVDEVRVSTSTKSTP